MSNPWPVPYWPPAGTTITTGTDYTVLASNCDGTLWVTTGAVDRTITLPLAADCRDTMRLDIVKVDSGVGRVLITPVPPDLIMGDTEAVINVQHMSLTIRSDGTGFRIV